jgi:serine/threonine protein kinase
MIFDDYEILREVYASSRSHVLLARDTETNTQVVINTPYIDLRGDPAYLKRFLMEEWIARRINNAHVLRPCLQTRKRNYLYIVTEYIDGQVWHAGRGRRANASCSLQGGDYRRLCLPTRSSTTSMS